MLNRLQLELKHYYTNYDDLPNLPLFYLPFNINIILRT